MNKIKNIIFAIGITILLLTGCKNDDVMPAETELEKLDSVLLTKIFRNGVSFLELYYGIDRKLYRIDYYFGGSLSSYNLYEYNEKGIKELRRYDALDHALEYRTVFTLDNFGRVIKGENYSSPNFDDVASISEFSYNTLGQLAVKQFRLSGQPVYTREEYTYDSLNNLISRINTVKPNQPEEYLNYQLDYTPGTSTVPEYWQEYVFILGISSLDEGVREMFNEGNYFQGWDSDQELTSELSYEASGRQYDDDGNLVRQIITRKNILNPGTDQVSEMTYEYYP